MNSFMFYIFVFIFATNVEAKKIYYQTDLSYIEVLSSDVTVLCSKINPDGLSFTSLIVETKDSIHHFINRRPWPIETCLWRKAETEKVLRDNKVRIFGTQVYIDTDHKNNKKSYSWIFERIDNDNGKCFSYFEHACNDKNFVSDAEKFNGSNI
ncbi:MAG: hypothetical protein JNM93_07725 [Bacteriovoracaceae bacterium]|nr:hypothetical protein [Bacteriovoracaceae bacterium]